MDSILESMWSAFTTRYALSADQLAQFKRYAELLQQASLNVTSLHTLSDIVQYHFADSLEARFVLDWKSIASYIDVGSGGGLPGIPLKIMAPHSSVILLE